MRRPFSSARDSTPNLDNSARLRSLDGLRGLAAFAVLGFHASALNPAIGTWVVKGSNPPSAFSPEWWAVLSPLRLFTAGDEAVFIFFVLSGLVLTRPVLSVASFDWMKFSASRVLRLFIPAAASLLFAYVLVRMIPRTPDATLSLWLTEPYNPYSLSIGQLLRDFDLIFSNFLVNGPTWTLRWELLFSLLLPFGIAIVAFALRTKPLGLGAIIAAVIVVGLQFGVSALVYLPIFLLGVVIAFQLEVWTSRYQSFAVARPRESRWFRWSLLTIAFIALCAYLLLKPYVDPSGPAAVAARVLSVFGASMIVAITAVCWPSTGLLSTRWAKWAGGISFSLYLVHQPILATFGFLFGAERWAVAAGIGVAVSFVVAMVFWRLIEAPSHKFSRRFGEWATAQVPVVKNSKGSADSLVQESTGKVSPN